MRDSLRNAHRQALKALQEGAVMLAAQQRRGHDDGHLIARHDRDKGRAQGDFGFAKADIAADQPVHRTAAGEIILHRLDGAHLILGFLIGKAGAKFVVYIPSGG